MESENYQDKLDIFYTNNQEELEESWQEHLTFHDWGSGEDRINITDDMFWEFVQDRMEIWGA